MKFNFNNPPIGKRIKETIIGVASLGVGMSASAQKAENKQADPVKPTTETVAKAYANAEKFTTDPTKQGYTKAKVTDDKTFYIKTSGGSESSVAKATPGGPKDDKANEEFLIAELKKGVSPEDLVRGGHAGAVGIQKLAHFYTPPAVKVVFTENAPTPKVESDPFAGFSKDVERKYIDTKAAFDLFYPVKNTHDIKDAGMLNTSEQDVLIRILDRRYNHEGIYTGDFVILTDDEYRKISGLKDGSKYLSQAALDEIIKRAKEFTASQRNKTADHSNEDIAKENK